jgi:PadR family transcriptional regulator, regulatory protein PadR
MAAYLGEFEQLLLLTVLRLGSDAFGTDIARDLDQRAGRSVSRGALYTSLDRLEDKGLVRWKVESGTPARNGLPRRVYAVTPTGLAALRESRNTLQRMWRGLEHLLKDPTS